ncbi:MAG TPA: hypothetical protein VFE50_21810 [Cyclobacteriaceae bacterium]|nr:hypothetical protein [Cyclobacteriaceae bacterium]
MKSILIILALVAQAAVFGQSIEELDKKGGFKEFRVGDSLSVHQDKIKFMKTLDNADTKLYLVKELVSVKSYTGEVELEFYKGKIQEIIVSFKNSTKPGFEDILKSLETLYGKPEKSKEKSPGTARFERLLVWNGQQVILRLGYDENYKLTEMVYYGANSLAKLKEEF